MLLKVLQMVLIYLFLGMVLKICCLSYAYDGSNLAVLLKALLWCWNEFESYEFECDLPNSGDY